jgi:hypothetical protein
MTTALDEFKNTSIKDTVAIGIRGCIFDTWLGNWQECLDTWAGLMINEGWRVKVNIGHPELDAPYKDINHFFVCKTTENPAGVFFKSVYYPSKWLLEQDKYTHIFITDSDSFVHPKRFSETLEVLTSLYGELDYVGALRTLPHIAEYMPGVTYSDIIDLNVGLNTHPGLFCFASGGSGFLLSKKAANAVVKAIDSEEYLSYEGFYDAWLYSDDCLLGVILRKANIRFIYSSAFQSTSPKINDIPNYNPPAIEDERGSHICVQHYRKGDMFKILEKLNLNKQIV